MTVLIDFPAFLFHRFLQDWCKCIDLVRLDTALCANAIRTDQFVLKTSLSFLWYDTHLIRWLLRRGVSVNFLCITFSMVPYINKGDSLAKVTRSLNNLSLDILSQADQVAVRALLQVSPSVHELCVCGCYFDDELYGSISQTCPDIKKLDLHDVHLSYNSTQRMLQGFVQLELLELSYGVFTNAAMLHVAFLCPHLKAFIYNEENCEDVRLSPFYLTKSLSSDVLAVICSMCTQLRILTLYYDYDQPRTMNLSVVYHIIAQRLPHLRTLDIGGVTTSDNTGLGLVFINRNTLRHVEVDADGLSNESFVSLLYQNAGLWRVSLDNHNHIVTGVNTTNIPLHLNRLRYLMLTTFSALTNEGMRCILQACPIINNLSISGAPLITPNSVVPLIVQLCPHMYMAYFDNCLQFTQANVDELLPNCGSRKLRIGVNTGGGGYCYDNYDDIRKLDDYQND